MKPWRTIHNPRLAYDATEEPVVFFYVTAHDGQRVFSVEGCGQPHCLLP